jgi:rhomboid family GlyGly-CTERM serine protease
MIMKIRRYWDIAVLGVLLVILNLHLFGVPVDHRWLVASPSALSAGRVWTLFTHAFVHVSWYHLLLDAGAVLTLYSLVADDARRRVSAFLACMAGSLIAALCYPGVSEYGFCGLSGIAHGLMGLYGCRMMADARRGERWQGAAVLAVVLAKSMFEVASGGVVFGGLHVGDVGVPNTWSHLGGVLGGVVCWGFFLPTAAWLRIFRVT